LVILKVALPFVGAVDGPMAAGAPSASISGLPISGSADTPATVHVAVCLFIRKFSSTMFFFLHGNV
jgi:hypothetical protein